MPAIFRRCLTLPILIAVLASMTLADRAAAQERTPPIEVGLAARDITPPVPYRMGGYFTERLSTGVKDPLLAKAMVVRQGGRGAALVFCDLVAIDADVSRRARQLVEQLAGIPSERVVVAATHAHTGPLYAGALRDHFHERAIEQHGHDPHETADYPGTLARRIARAVVDAAESARPAQLVVGSAHQEGLSYNRRFVMEDGSVRFNPGVNNPNIVEPAGPIDPEVNFLLVRDRVLQEGQTGQPRGSLTVFPLHLDTVGGTEYSADYPLYLQRRLRERFGPGFLSLFGAGTCGDINHINVQSERRLQTELIGNTLGETIVNAFDGFRPVEVPGLAFRRAVVDAPRQRYSEAERAEAREMMQRVADGSVPFLDRVRAYKIVDLQRFGDTIPLEVQAIRLGDDTAVVALPGEVFVELGLAIKDASPFEHTFVIELANRNVAYIPTERAFEEGSYEVVNSRVAKGAGEMLVEQAGELLDELHAGSR